MGSSSVEGAEAASAVSMAGGKKKRNSYASACALLASMTSILLGYDIGVMSGALIYIKKDLSINDVEYEVMAGILNFYSIIGSFMAGRTSDWIGRRYTIVLAGGIFFVGALAMGFAPNYGWLMFGRFIAGIGVGYGLMIAPVYTAEVAPTSTRGFLTSFPEVFINFGILLGYVSNYFFSKMPINLGWRFMLGVGAVPAVVIALGVLAMPESPRWLAMQGRIGEAEKVLRRTSDSEEEAELRLSDIKMVAGIPANCTDDVVVLPKSRHHHGEGVWKELLLCQSSVVRRVLLAALGIHFFQQASGIDSVVLYSPRIFEKAGINNDNQRLLVTVAVGFTKTLFILVATFLLDRLGRRPLLLTSVAGMIVSLALLGTGLTIVNHHQHPLVAVPWAVAICITTILTYVAFFSIGMGPITWVYTSEVFPLRLRAQGASLGVIVNRGISGAISISFISLSNAITSGGAFFLYGGIAVIAWVFFFIYLPETKGKTLEEMETLFGKLPPPSGEDEEEEEEKEKGEEKKEVELGGVGNSNKEVVVNGSGA